MFGLARGAAVTHIATGRHVSPNAVLMQIKHVLEKTNTDRETLLLGNIVRSLAAAAPPTAFQAS